MAEIRLILGDSFEVIATLEGVGAVVSDPPYLISFMNKDWDEEVEGAQSAQWHQRWLQACFDILPSGGVVKVFSATRTFHRLAAAIEAVGFVDIDQEAWGQGQGFPKYLNTAKAIDAHLGKKDERPVLGQVVRPDGTTRNRESWSKGASTYAQDKWTQSNPSRGQSHITEAATEEAARFEGWATALKPGWEPFVVGRKP